VTESVLELLNYILLLSSSPTLRCGAFSNVGREKWLGDTTKEPDTHKQQRSDHTSVKQEDGSEYILGVHSKMQRDCPLRVNPISGES